MKGISGKQIFTYTVLLSIICVAAVYFMVYSKNMDKVETLKASNATLETRVNSLKTYYDSQQGYKDDMAKMQPEMDKILSQYVSDVREEDQIMQAVISQRAATVLYDTLSLTTKADLLRIPQELVAGANVEKYQNEIAFQQKTASYSNTLDYHNLKNIIKSIFESEYNIGIKTISYAKQDSVDAVLYGFVDEETGQMIYVKKPAGEEVRGCLQGTLDLEFYCVEGNGVEYTKPDMSEYDSGTIDFFGLTVIEEEEEEVE